MRQGTMRSAVKLIASLGASATAVLALGALPAAAGALSPLPKGAEIPLRSCTYGPGETHNGRESGQYLVDRNAYYAIAFVPTDLPGGHFRFRGVYPRARWFSFESYDEDLASQGVIADTEIAPDPGSINPFYAGNKYKDNQHYTVNVLMVPPSERAHPTPENTLYSGYRENPNYGDVETSAVDGLLYRVYAAPGTPEGNVPLPTLSWVVENPETNPFKEEAEVCAAMHTTAADQTTVLTLNQILAQRFSNPTLSPDEKDLNVPTDEVPRNPPYVDVIRPATNGYQGAYFNSKTPYIFFRPNGELYGNFVAVRFKAPTFADFPQKPMTGNEQVRYWSWCDDQFVSPVNITIGCLRDDQFKLEPDGYATLVISEESQRPVVKGKPWQNWLPWPGGGADVVMRQIDPNPATFPQSPYFYPVLDEDDALDYLLGVLYEEQTKQWMGEYFPTVRFCTKEKFERSECFT
jgi:hypothetical protein